MRATALILFAVVLAIAMLSWATACIEVRNPAYCGRNEDCPKSAPICAPSRRCVIQVCTDGGCIGTIDGMPPAMCTTSSQCDPSMPICEPVAGLCHPCASLDDGQCKLRSPMTPRCGSGGTCVACRPETATIDCPAQAPVCGDDGSCRGCRAHAECPSLVCNDDGSCTAESGIVYVDIQGCAAGAKDGSRLGPYCQVRDAVKNLGSHAIVRVAPSGANPYEAITLVNLTITIVGPDGGPESTTAHIFSSGADGIGIPAGGNVIIDGLDVRGGAANYGIACNGAATLKVVRTSIHDSSLTGIYSAACNVTLDRDIIGPTNSNGGLDLHGGSYNVQNCFIVANGPKAPAVTLGSQATGVFRHNTVTGNFSIDSFAGIDCGSSMKNIENSIIVMNHKNPQSKSQLAGMCQLSFDDIDDDALPPGAGNRNLPPHFVNLSKFDLHLDPVADNLACCIDQIAMSKTDHDIDGTPRPQPSGGKYDIGAHEVK